MCVLRVQGLTHLNISSSSSSPCLSAKVHNPVSILTQEMSKHFLHSKGEGDKYKVSRGLIALSFLNDHEVTLERVKSNNIVNCFKMVCRIFKM